MGRRGLREREGLQAGIGTACATHQVQNVGSYAVTGFAPPAFATSGLAGQDRFENYQPPRTYGMEFHDRF